jgi:exosortase H (IPTLxxWG-CTERM-specific)
MIRFLLVFMLLLPVLMVLELTAPAQQWLSSLTSLLTRITAFLLSAFDANAMSYGKILLDTRSGIGVSVEAGCNGVEACLILLAAMLAYPAPWKLKLLGILGGSVVVQAVNVLRVISCFISQDGTRISLSLPTCICGKP